MLHFPKLHSGSVKIDGAWGSMINLLRRFVEHFPVTNVARAPIPIGSVLNIGGPRSVDMAIANNVARADWIGIAAEYSEDTEQLVMATGNITRVRMDAGLTLNFNEPVYVSPTTNGVATNKLPVGPGEFVAQIGWIWDASIYVDGVNMYADVIINRCCDPVAVG